MSTPKHARLCSSLHFSAWLPWVMRGVHQVGALVELPSCLDCCTFLWDCGSCLRHRKRRICSCMVCALRQLPSATVDISCVPCAWRCLCSHHNPAAGFALQSCRILQFLEGSQVFIRALAGLRHLLHGCGWSAPFFVVAISWQLWPGSIRQRVNASEVRCARRDGMLLQGWIQKAIFV